MNKRTAESWVIANTVYFAAHRIIVNCSRYSPKWLPSFANYCHFSTPFHCWKVKNCRIVQFIPLSTSIYHGYLHSNWNHGNATIYFERNELFNIFPTSALWFRSWSVIFFQRNVQYPFLRRVAAFEATCQDSSNRKLRKRPPNVHRSKVWRRISLTFFLCAPFVIIRMFFVFNIFNFYLISRYFLKQFYQRHHYLRKKKLLTFF